VDLTLAELLGKPSWHQNDAGRSVPESGFGWSTGCSSSISGEDSFYCEGLVVRHKAVPAELRRLERQGMGVRFLRPSEIVERVLPEHLRGPSMSLDCPSPIALDKLISDQLDGRVLLLPAGATPPVAEQQVQFQIRLTFHPDTPAPIGKGRVVQLLDACFGPGEAGKGAVVEVEDAPKLAEALRAAVSKPAGP